MTLNIDSKSPTSDQIDAMVREAHKLRAEAFGRFLSKVGTGIKGSVYPKGARKTLAANAPKAA